MTLLLDHEVDAATEEENRERESRGAFKITALGEDGCPRPTWFRKDGKLSVMED